MGDKLVRLLSRLIMSNRRVSRRVLSLLFAVMTSNLNSSIAKADIVLDAEPRDGLADTPFAIKVSGAPPNAKVLISASFMDQQHVPQTWTAFGTYISNRQGHVDTTTFPSLTGTYTGILPGGLTCSALPVPPSSLAEYVRTFPKNPHPNMPVLDQKADFSIVVHASVNGNPVLPITIVRRYMSPAVTRAEISEGDIHGVYFEPPPNIEKGIPVVAFSGSGGGILAAQAMLLASRGHPTLALAYFNYKGLPSALMNIPIETFSDAASWLSRKTGVQRVVLMGASRGTEAAQLAAAYFPEHVAGVVLYAPSPIVHGDVGPGTDYTKSAWTVGGVPVPFDPSYKVGSGSLEPPGRSESATFLPLWNNPAEYYFYATPVARIGVPMLLLAGEDDAEWPSALGAKTIKERMTQFGKGALVEMHLFPNAGHPLVRVGMGSLMSTFAWRPDQASWHSTGGRPEANCAASFDAWAINLKFLESIALSK